MRKLKLILCTVLLFAAFGVVRAQEQAQEQTQEQAKEPKTEKATKSPISKWLNFSGYVNLQYTFAYDGTGVQDDDNVSTFQVRRARLDMKGAPAKWLEYRLQLEMASPKIVDAFIKFNISPLFAVQVGQQKLPFTLENPFSPLALEAIDNAQVISKLSGYSDLSGVSATGRDLGLALIGGFFPRNGFNIIDYNVGIFNGNGINVKDNNQMKDFVGRVEVHPIKALTFSGSFYVGKMNGVTHTWEPKNRYAASLAYNDGKFNFRAEYLIGTTAALKSHGYYAVLGYWITPKVCPVLRYDYFREDVNIKGSGSTFGMVGIDYWPASFVRLQLNYTLKDVQTPLMGHLPLVHQVTAMASIKF